MAQHDLVIDNGPGLAVRTDINAALQAVATNYSGPTEPTAMYPGMWWLDTSSGTNGTLRMRDLANGAWISPPTTGYVAKAGDTMTGNLTITKASASFYLNKAASGQSAAIYGQMGGSTRWTIELGNVALETGANAGSPFVIARFADNGTILGTALSIARNNGLVSVGTSLSVTDVTTSSTFSAVSGIYASGAAVGLFLASGNGNIYLRPNGAGTTTGQLTIDTAGVVTGAGSFVSSGTNVILATTGAGGVFLRPNGAGSTTGQGLLNSAGGFTVTQGSKPGGGVWLDSSDARIKTVHGTYDSGLDEVLALNPVRFTFKGNETYREPAADAEGEGEGAGAPTIAPRSPHADVLDKEFIGLVAQEAEISMPEMVTQTEAWIDGEQVTDMRQLDTTPLIFALVNAIKDLSARLESLEAGR